VIDGEIFPTVLRSFIFVAIPLVPSRIKVITPLFPVLKLFPGQWRHTQGFGEWVVSLCPLRRSALFEF
jgi:hypothetical protein